MKFYTFGGAPQALMRLSALKARKRQEYREDGEGTEKFSAALSEAAQQYQRMHVQPTNVFLGWGARLNFELYLPIMLRTSMEFVILAPFNDFTSVTAA